MVMTATKLNTVADATVKGQAIHDLALASGGAHQISTLRLAANVADTETFTLGDDTFEINVIATDTGFNVGEVTAGEMGSVTDNYLTVPNAAAASITGGSVLGIESEYLLVSSATAGATNTTVKVIRGYAGSTAATHADTTDVFEAVQNVTAGNIAVPITSTLTPTATGTLIVAAVNAEGTGDVTATKIGTNELLLSRPADGIQTACSETLAGTDNTIDPEFHGGVVSGAAVSAVTSRVPTATEVTLGSMNFVFPFSAVSATVVVTTTATGAVAAWDGAVAIAGGIVTLDNAGAVDWATTSTVTVIASGHVGDAPA